MKISPEQIEKLIVEGVTRVPPYVEEKIRRIHSHSKGVERMQLGTMLEAIEIARKKKVPLCQDTGVAMFFVRIGRNAKFNGIEFEKSVKKTLERMHILRKNVISPFSKRNKGNVGVGIPVFHYEFSSDLIDEAEITYVPKGGGSENGSALCMLNPNEGKERIIKFAVAHVKKLGAKACPPYIIGIGIGGTADSALLLSKKAMGRDFNSNGNKEIEELEEEILKKVNALGIGVMGFGGKNTALKVNVEVNDAHIASLPVGISVSCWALRKAKIILSDEG